MSDRPIRHDEGTPYGRPTPHYLNSLSHAELAADMRRHLSVVHDLLNQQRRRQGSSLRDTGYRMTPELRDAIDRAVAYDDEVRRRRPPCPTGPDDRYDRGELREQKAWEAYERGRGGRVAGVDREME